MSYLLSGSFAYDEILMHDGHFHSRILPEAVNNLNVYFGIKDYKTEFGGTAGNISYNAGLLNEDVTLCASVGNDFHSYEMHLIKNGLSSSTLTKYENDITAHFWIMTDESNNQITCGKAGAMKSPPVIPNNAYNLKLWHIAPDSTTTIAIMVKEAIKNNIDYFLDPGQALPLLLEGHIENIYPFEKMVENAKGLFVNEYESKLLQDKFKKPLEEFFNKKKLFIVETLGSKGLNIHTKDGQIFVPVAKPERIVDPTGCGDALRAGFLYAYSRGLSLKKCAELGSIMGSFAIENSGGQNHKPTKEEISARLSYTYDWTIT
jgi:adenosine kinase